MDTLSYKTISANKATVKKSWVLVDAKDEVLGRLASMVALILRGKHKPEFTPHVDCGDNVIVINADKIKLTGSKWDDKEYVRHTGYPGGQRITKAKDLMKKNPIAMVEKSVKELKKLLEENEEEVRKNGYYVKAFFLFLSLLNFLSTAPSFGAQIV